MKLVCIFQVCIHLQRYGVIIVSVYSGGKAGFEDTMSNNNLYVDGEEMFLWDIVLNVLTVK